MAKEPLTIDGSQGEGGGQIVRSSLSLSMVTGRGVIIDNIRAGRKKPGLLRQHLTAVRAAAEICGAGVEVTNFVRCVWYSSRGLFVGIQQVGSGCRTI